MKGRAKKTGKLEAKGLTTQLQVLCLITLLKFFRLKRHTSTIQFELSISGTVIDKTMRFSDLTKHQDLLKIKSPAPWGGRGLSVSVKGA